MKQKKINRLFILIILFSLVFLPFLGQAKKYSGYDFLSFGEYISFGASVKEGKKIDWAFSGSNSYVGIYVFAMDQVNYNKFAADDLSAMVYELSNGNYIADYGTFTARSDDTWFIVFLNFDIILESTWLDYEVTFPGNAGMIIGIIIGALVVIGIIGAAISSIKKKRTPEVEYQPVAAMGYQPMTPTQQTIPEEQSTQAQPVVAPKFCTNCGAALEGKFCTQCGAQN